MHWAVLNACTVWVKKSSLRFCDISPQTIGKFQSKFYMPTIQGGPKNWHRFFLHALTLPNINRLSKLFHCQNQEKICNNIVAEDPTTPQVCRYTTLRNISVIKATIENKMTFVTTQFKKLTTGNNMFIVSVIVQSNCHILQVYIKCSMCPPCCWRRTQAGDATDQWRINENQLTFDEVKAYKNYTKFLGHPDVIPAGCDSYFRQ